MKTKNDTNKKMAMLTTFAAWCFCIGQAFAGVPQVKLTNPVLTTIDCTTPTPTGSASQSFCGSVTVASLAATGTSIQWYAGASGGTAIPTSTALASGNYYGTQTVAGCESPTRLLVAVTVNPAPVAFQPDDLATCSATPVGVFYLPQQNAAILNGQSAVTNIVSFHTTAGGAAANTNSITNPNSFMALNGTVVYVRVKSTSGNCFSVTSFHLIVNLTPPVDSPADVSSCASYTLPALVNGNYFTELNGTGTPLFAGNVITETTTLYIFNHPDAPSGCSAGSSFTVTIIIPTAYYADTDLDGFGNASAVALSCSGIPDGYVTNSLDCNDAAILYTDADGDGFGTTVVAACGAANTTDCNDANPAMHALYSFYADTDHDNYGAGSAVPFCAANAGAAPVNYASNSTDCNDTKASVHPNAIEIAYNLIDDDCDNLIDEGYPPISTVIQQCNYTLAAIDTNVYANLVSGAQGYRWKVTTMSGPTLGQVQYLDTALRVMKITQLGTYAFDTDYKLEVGVYYAGFLQPYTTSTCTVSTPATLTQLVACSGTLSSMSDVVYANAVPFATGYKFQVTDPENPSDSQELIRATREFRMTLITDFDVHYGKFYNVKVAVRNIDGTYLPYGPTCTLGTPIFPTTSLQESQCDDYNVGSASTIIYATSYPAAIRYAFLVKGYGLPTAGVEVVKQLRAFSLGDFPQLTAGHTYTVRVRLIFNIADPNGPYGKSCSLVLPAARNEAANTKAVFRPVAYPNPFGQNFNIEVGTSGPEKVAIKIYDMTGRLLDIKQITSSEMGSLKIGDQYPSGVYNVIVSQGEKVQALRVIKR